jgi:hypothetical protein
MDTSEWMRPEDTSPEAWRILLDIYRQMTLEEKLQRTFEMSTFLRSVVEAGIRADYPQASEREIFLRLAQRTLGNDLFEKVYGDVIPR